MKKILLNILTHGDEFIGKRVADTITMRYPTLLGISLDIQIANEQAYKRGKRYITHDLNRVFPGNPIGSYEERRAYELVQKISLYDLVIDVHSTESGSGDMVIVTKLDSETKKIVDYIGPQYVLFMNMKPDTSLISCAKIGIALEMGSDKSEETFNKTLTGIELILSYYNLVPQKYSFGHSPEYFEVLSSVPKPPNAKLKPHIRNFEPIVAGDVFAENIDGSPILADHDFYPVIFGNVNYETIFGFSAQRLTI